MNNNIEMLLTNFLLNKWSFLEVSLEQISLNTGPKIEGLILIVMDKSFHEEYSAQSLQTNNNQFKIAVTLLPGYNGIFNITTLNNKFYFKKSIIDEDFNQITVPPAAYELESLNN